MSSYRPDIYGFTPPTKMWALFAGISQRWALTTQEKVDLLHTDPEPAGSPDPQGETAVRLELLKDCFMMISAIQKPEQDPHGCAWVHRTMPVFGNLTPLETMAATPQRLHRLKPLDGDLSIYWHPLAKPKETMGLELVRGLFAFNKPDVGAYAQAQARLAQLITDGERTRNGSRLC
jgi:hypothetical protein